MSNKIEVSVALSDDYSGGVGVVVRIYDDGGTVWPVLKMASLEEAEKVAWKILDACTMARFRAGMGSRTPKTSVHVAEMK
jgi:hypothetical protein